MAEVARVLEAEVVARTQAGPIGRVMAGRVGCPAVQPLRAALRLRTEPWRRLRGRGPVGWVLLAAEAPRNVRTIAPTAWPHAPRGRS